MAAKQAAATAPRRKGMSKELRENLIAYSFIAPNFIGFCVFTLVPVVAAFVLAFMEWDGVNAAKFVGLANFTRMFGDPNFKAAFWHTIVYVIGTVPATIICALALAILLNQKIKGRNFFLKTFSASPICQAPFTMGIPSTLVTVPASCIRASICG